MSNPISNLKVLLASMAPTLNKGVYYFATLKPEQHLPISDFIATIREEEGLSVVVSEETAKIYSIETQFKAAWITLTVHSDLAAVGLTAAFANALGQANISCNVVAGNFHDHIFVPYEKADLAMSVLRGLQQSSVENHQK
ncbi:ACT domain-containing protein [Rodentibacter trehalosifermentans]|uniref:ACT domain-containing protein n=1 Tax=Rodentibacter trehalosifermentans TaxID=1908263 RepID=UPI000985ACF2|nr:ACT domain-containing protein [Rodentibacter trehalosifermentans]OOF52261.1 acetyltransferase [Rodentibacter trehalosifermentans]